MPFLNTNLLIDKLPKMVLVVWYHLHMPHLEQGWGMDNAAIIFITLPSKNTITEICRSQKYTSAVGRNQAPVRLK